MQKRYAAAEREIQDSELLIACRYIPRGCAYAANPFRSDRFFRPSSQQTQRSLRTLVY